MNISNLAFNNTKTHVTCCTDSGCTIYSILPELENRSKIEFNKKLNLSRLYKKTNLILLVGSDKVFKKDSTIMSNTNVILWDQYRNESIIEIDMKDDIKNVDICEDKIIVVLERKVCIFDFSGTMIDSKDTYCNELGMYVTNNNDNKIDKFVVPGIQKGQIAIWKPNSELYKTINAHTSNIESIAINNRGDLIATASERGTLVRIFDMEGDVKYEFRRGTQYAQIYSLCFSSDSKLLACCSSNGTIHYFDIYSDLEESKNTSSLLATFKNYLPTYFSSQWSFKQLNLNNTSKKVITFDSDNNLHVVTYDGYYYKINNYDNIIEYKL